MAYTYADTMADIASFAADYPFLRFFKFGQSVMGKPLYGIKIGTGPKKVLYVSGHHSLEWLTSAMIMSFVRAYADAIKYGKNLVRLQCAGISRRNDDVYYPYAQPRRHRPCRRQNT